MKFKKNFKNILLPLLFTLLIVFEFVSSMGLLDGEMMFVQLFLNFNYLILFGVFLLVYTQIKSLSKYPLYFIFFGAIINSIYLYNSLGVYSILIIITSVLGIYVTSSLFRPSRKLKKGISKVELLKRELKDKLDQDVEIYHGSERISNKDLEIYHDENGEPKIRPSKKSVEEIDINTASVSELQEIKFIGKSRAEEIIRKRPFSSIDELINVSGITKNRLKQIKKEGKAYLS